MARLAHRLERRKRLYLWDYYAAGKLIHYTVDAFTSCHNDHFPSQLQAHREYENQLQAYFLSYLAVSDVPNLNAADSVMEAISHYHRQYIKKPADIRRDTRYCVQVTCLIVYMLFT